MTDLELLECAQSVYDYLIDDTDADIQLINFNKSFMDITLSKNMNKTLIKHGYGKDHGDMILFTLFLNEQYKVYEQDYFHKIMRLNAKDFFSTTKSHDFYRSIIRDLKLKLCLNYQNSE